MPCAVCAQFVPPFYLLGNPGIALTSNLLLRTGQFVRRAWLGMGMLNELRLPSYLVFSHRVGNLGSHLCRELFLLAAMSRLINAMYEMISLKFFHVRAALNLDCRCLLGCRGVCRARELRALV